MPDGEYKTYTDGNRVVWSIYYTNQYMFAHTPLDQDVTYRETPADLQAVRTGSDTEADRAAFIRLRKLIDDYATEHKGEVQLRVSAKRDGGWLPFVLLMAAIYYTGER